MRSRNSLEGSKATKEVKSIFSFTEVNTKPLLPNVKSAPSILKSQSRVTPSNSVFSNFISSKTHSGNLSPREISSSTREHFVKLEEKLRHEFKTNLKNSTSRVKYLPKDLENYKQSVLNKKAAFNKIHNAVREKQNILAGLVNKYEELCALGSEENSENLLKRKNSECKELETGTKNEQGYTEVLKYLINRTKAENLNTAEPINSLKKQLSQVKQEVFVTEKVLMQISENASELEKKYESELGKFSQLRAELDQFTEEKSKIFEGKMKLKLSAENEQKRNLAVMRQENSEKRLKNLQNMLNDCKKKEVLKTEIQEFQDFCDSEKEKFSIIQKVTNVNNAEEILTHFQYLQNTKHQLMNSVNFSLTQIENLNSQQKFLNSELEDLKFKSRFLKISENDIQNIEKSVSQKGKNIEKYENRLENLEKIIVTALNTFSRISELLGFDQTFSKLRSENLLSCVNASYNKLKFIIDNAKIKEESYSSSSDLSLSDKSSIQLVFS